MTDTATHAVFATPCWIGSFKALEDLAEALTAEAERITDREDGAHTLQSVVERSVPLSPAPNATWRQLGHVLQAVIDEIAANLPPEARIIPPLTTRLWVMRIEGVTAGAPDRAPLRRRHTRSLLTAVLDPARAWPLADPQPTKLIFSDPGGYSGHTRPSSMSVDLEPSTLCIFPSYLDTSVALPLAPKAIIVAEGITLP